MPVTGNNQLHYNLSIRITADGFSFFVTEAVSGDLMCRTNYTLEKDESLSMALARQCVNPTISQFTFDNVRVITDGETTCVPLSDFNPETAEAIYQQVFLEADTTDLLVCYTPLPLLGVTEIFLVPKTIHNTIVRFFPKAAFTNVYATAMQRMASFCQRTTLTSCPLFVYAQQSNLFVFCIYNDKLLFANSFIIEHEQDALYFLLSVWKELKLDAKENTCYISGEQNVAQNLANEARNYLHNVEQKEMLNLGNVEQ